MDTGWTGRKQSIRVRSGRSCCRSHMQGCQFVVVGLGIQENTLKFKGKHFDVMSSSFGGVLRNGVNLSTTRHSLLLATGFQSL